MSCDFIVCLNMSLNLLSSVNVFALVGFETEFWFKTMI